MLLISYFASSRNYQSSLMHPYLKYWTIATVSNPNPVACNSLQLYGMLKVKSTHMVDF